MENSIPLIICVYLQSSKEYTSEVKADMLIIFSFKLL